MENKKCLFCEKKVMGPQFIFTGKHVSLIYPRSPVSLGHFMIITNRHVTFMGDLKDEEVLEIRDLIKKITNKFIDDGKFNGFNVLNNNDKSANQHVPHFHLHIFLRAKDEEYSPLDILSKKEPKHNISKKDWENNLKNIRKKFINNSMK